VQANFTGPSYTLGVEEELMILDGETFALANEIEAIVDAYEGDGEVKPELLQSVLEIATPVSKDLAEVGEHVGCGHGQVQGQAGGEVTVGQAADAVRAEQASHWAAARGQRLLY